MSTDGESKKLPGNISEGENELSDSFSESKPSSKSGDAFLSTVHFFCESNHYLLDETSNVVNIFPSSTISSNIELQLTDPQSKSSKKFQKIDNNSVETINPNHVFESNSHKNDTSGQLCIDSTETRQTNKIEKKSTEDRIKIPQSPYFDKSQNNYNQTALTEHLNVIQKLNQKIKDETDLQVLQDLFGEKLKIVKNIKSIEASIEIYKNHQITQNHFQETGLTMCFRIEHALGIKSMKFELKNIKGVKKQYQKSLNILLTNFEKRPDRDWTLAYEFFVRVVEILSEATNENLISMMDIWKMEAEIQKNEEIENGLKVHEHILKRSDSGFEKESNAQIDIKHDKVEFFLNNEVHQNAIKTEFSKNEFLEACLQTKKENYSRYKNDFQEIKELGTGGFGSVYKVKNCLDGNLYAVKIIDFDSAFSKQELSSILQEVKLLSKLSHPNIVRYYQAWIEETQIDESNIEISTENMLNTNFNTSKRKVNFHKGSIEERFDNFDQKELQRQISPKKSPKGTSPMKKPITTESKFAQKGLEKYQESSSENERKSSLKLKEQNQTSSDLVIEFQKTHVEMNDLEIDFQKAPEDNQDESDVNSTLQNDEDTIRTISGDESQKEDSFDEMKKVQSKKQTQHHLTVNNKSLFIQMEFCENMTLKEHINNYSIVNPTDEQVIIKFLIQTINALNYIHSEGFIHRDLKPSNILLDAHKNIKLGDFGLAKHTALLIDDVKQQNPSHNFCSTMSHNIGTSYYISPEQKNSDKKYNCQTDMYSLGVVLLEMLLPPFRTVSEHLVTVINFLNDEKLPPCLINYKNNELVKLMLQLVDKDPARRPSSRKLYIRFSEALYQKHILSNVSEYKKIIDYLFSKTSNLKSESDEDHEKLTTLKKSEIERCEDVEKFFKKLFANIFRKYFVEKINSFPVTLFDDSFWVNISRIEQDSIEFQPVLLKGFSTLKDLDGMKVYLDRNADFNYQTNNPLNFMIDHLKKSSANNGKLFSNIGFNNSNSTNALCYINFFKKDNPKTEYKSFCNAETVKIVWDILGNFKECFTNMEIFVTSSLIFDAMLKKIKLISTNKSQSTDLVNKLFFFLRRFMSAEKFDFIQSLRTILGIDGLKAQQVMEFLTIGSLSLQEFFPKITKLFPNSEHIVKVSEEFRKLVDALGCLGIDSKYIRFCVIPPFEKCFPNFYSGFSFYIGCLNEKQNKTSVTSIKTNPLTLLAYGGRMENLFFDPNCQDSNLNFAIGFLLLKDVLSSLISSEILNNKQKLSTLFLNDKIVHETLSIMLAAYQSEMYPEMLKFAAELWEQGYRVTLHLKDVNNPAKFHKECRKKNIAMIIYVKPKMRESDKIRVKYLLKDSIEQDISFKIWEIWLANKRKFFENFKNDLANSMLFKKEN